jgi:NTE family protein
MAKGGQGPGTRGRDYAAGVSVALPDVLVLGGGGILGDAWMNGLLAGIEDAHGLDFRKCETYVGTSAGSIVSTRLAAGRPLHRPDGSGSDHPPAPSEDAAAAATENWLDGAAAVTVAAIAPLARLLPTAATATSRASAIARSLALRRAPEARRDLEDLRKGVEQIGIEFDGRLRISAVDRDSGRRVMFGAPGALPATVADAVVASCSIPGVFPPVEIGGRHYVDGGIWSPTNADAAPAGEATRVLCVSPTATLGMRSRPALGAVITAMRTATAFELAALRRRGAEVRFIAPDDDCAALMRENLMDPGPRAAVLAAGYKQGLHLR